MFTWDDQNCLTFRCTLTPSAEDDGHYVTEKTSLDWKSVKYGPMSADMVDPFIAERKQYWNTMAERALSRFASLTTP